MSFKPVTSFHSFVHRSSSRGRCLPAPPHSDLTCATAKGRSRWQRQSAGPSSCGQASSSHSPHRGLCYPGGGGAFPCEFSRPQNTHQTRAWTTHTVLLLITRFWPALLWKRQVAGLLKDRDFALAGRTENGPPCKERIQCPRRSSWLVNEMTIDWLMMLFCLSTSSVLKCEYCGSLAPASQFRGSKRFCSNTCAKR